MMINDSFNMLGPTIDMMWVGRLGVASVAGVGVSAMGVNLLVGARRGLSTGTRAMVARFVGAGDTRAANHVAQQAFVISAIYAISVAAIGVYLAEEILILFGLEPDVVAEGAAYMRIMFIGGVATSYRMMGEGIMEASGDAMTPMKIAIFYRIFHIILCPFLIFGWWIFPSLGIRGAALTNVIAQGIAGILQLWILFSRRTRLRLTLRNFSFAPSIIWRIAKIGLPATVTGMERTFG